MSDIIEFSPEKRLIWKYLIMLIFRFGFSFLIIIVFNLIEVIILILGKIITSENFPDPFDTIVYFVSRNMVYIIAMIAVTCVILYLLVIYRNTIVYRILEDEIHVFRGLITKSHMVVPFRTITNIGIMRYPSDRLTGLGTIEIHTAGGSSGSGFLPEKKAEQKIEGIKFNELSLIIERIINKIPKSIKSQGTGFLGDNKTGLSKSETKSKLLQDILIEFKGIRSDLQLD